MHAVHGTIGHDPAATAAAEGRDLYAPTTKQESRERWFEARRAYFAKAAGHLGRSYNQDADLSFNQQAVVETQASRLGEERKFVARWNNDKGQATGWSTSAGLSAEATARLLAILFRNGVTVVNVEAV